MRLIDADELLKQIQTTYCRDCKDCNKDKDFFHCCIEQIIGDIQYAPTVDPWHYPAKGELPTEKELLLMKIPGCYVLGWYYKKNWFMDDGELTVLPYDVSRWQYIVPPQEEV